MASMAGKLAVVTGASSGIGERIAMGLARSGASVVMACRNLEKAQKVCDSIRQETGNEDVTVGELDLARFESVRDFSHQLSRLKGPDGRQRPLHVLINNAGLMLGEKHMTQDGYEETWQTNFLAASLLTLQLLPSLRLAAEAGGGAPGSARIIYVGSRLEKVGKLEDLDACSGKESDKDGTSDAADATDAGAATASTTSSSSSSSSKKKHVFSTFQAYSDSKQAATAWTYELARRLADSDSEPDKGITATVCTPGMVSTSLGRFAPWVLQPFVSFLSWTLLRTSEKGAETPLFLAMSDSELAKASGKYFYDCKTIESSPASHDPALAAKVWDHVQSAEKSFSWN